MKQQGFLRVQVIHYLRESNKALQMQVMLQGESDRQAINSVFKEEKPLRLELQRKRLHQAIEITFDKYCVSTSTCWHRRHPNSTKIRKCRTVNNLYRISIISSRSLPFMAIGQTTASAVNHSQSWSHGLWFRKTYLSSSIDSSTRSHRPPLILINI